MTQDWRLAASSLGRLSRGATVRVGGLGEVSVRTKHNQNDDTYEW